MKQLLNWRKWVQYALLSIGFFALVLIFGEDERPMGEWIEVRIYLALIATACFYSLGKLTKKWEREGKIESQTIEYNGNQD